jgi:hypothetical protein
MDVAPISECEVENGEINLYSYLSGDAGDLEMLKLLDNPKGLKFRFEGMQVGYSETAYHVASFANNPAKTDGSPYALKFSVWQESVPGCVQAYERSVKVLPRPKEFPITANSTIACNEDLAFVTASNGEIPGLTYQWRVNGAIKEGVSAASLPKSALDDGVNIVGAMAINADGCATAAANQISIKLTGFNPAVRFKGALAFCQNSGAFTLADILEGEDKEALLNGTGGYTYSVTSNPVGLFSQNALGVYSVSPALKSADDYLVTLVMNNGECEVYRTAALAILPIPTSFAVTPSTPNVVCNDEQVTLSASSAGVSGLAYRWYVNSAPVDGVAGSSLAKDYLSQGSNEVYAVATNSSGCSVRSDNTVTTTLHALNPAVAFSASSYTYCANVGKFSLHDLLAGDDKSKVLNRQEGMSYELTSVPALGLSISNSFGNYEVDPSQSTPQAYTVTLLVRRSNCEVRSAATLTILPIPTNFTVTSSSSNVICNGDPVTITAGNSGVAGLAYRWYVNSALVDGVTESSLAKEYLSEGSNAVYAVATNSSGCSVRSDNTVTTTLHTLAPEVELSTADYSYCANDEKFSLHSWLTGADKNKVLNNQDGMSYEFTSTPTGLNINNSFGNQEVDPAQSAAQKYTVTLWIRRNGCEVSRTATLTILPIPATYTLSASTPNVVCNDDPITISASSAGVSGLAYQWYVNSALVNGVTGSSLAKSYLSEGSNAVYTVATNSSGCAVRSGNTVTATLHTLAPAVEFTASGYSYCANAEKFSLSSLMSGAD